MKQYTLQRHYSIIDKTEKEIENKIEKEEYWIEGTLKDDDKVSGTGFIVDCLEDISKKLHSYYNRKMPIIITNRKTKQRYNSKLEIISD